MNSRTKFWCIFVSLVALFATAFVHPLLFLGIITLMLCAALAFVVSELWKALRED